MKDEQQKDLEKAAQTGHRLVAQDGRQRFPEITGLCRTCMHAHITRTRYSEVPTVICEALMNQNYRVPLDIMECSSYTRRGRLSLDDMTEIALLVDPKRVKAGFAR